jgi:hypothetical protein
MAATGPYNYSYIFKYIIIGKISLVTYIYMLYVMLQFEDLYILIKCVHRRFIRLIEAVLTSLKYIFPKRSILTSQNISLSTCNLASLLFGK